MGRALEIVDTICVVLIVLVLLTAIAASVVYMFTHVPYSITKQIRRTMYNREYIVKITVPREKKGTVDTDTFLNVDVKDMETVPTEKTVEALYDKYGAVSIWDRKHLQLLSKGYIDNTFPW